MEYSYIKLNENNEVTAILSKLRSQTTSLI